MDYCSFKVWHKLHNMTIKLFMNYEQSYVLHNLGYILGLG